MFTETEFYMKDYRFLEFKTNTSKKPTINIYVNHLTLQPEALIQASKTIYTTCTNNRPQIFVHTSIYLFL